MVHSMQAPSVGSTIHAACSYLRLLISIDDASPISVSIRKYYNTRVHTRERGHPTDLYVAWRAVLRSAV